MSKEKVGNVEIFNKILGDGQETIVFVNGISMTVDHWKFQMSFFKQNYKTLFHDLRGQLLSDNIDDNATIDTHVQDLKTLLDLKGEQNVHLVGAGYGARIAIIFAAKNPEFVKTLTLISASSQNSALMNAIYENFIKSAQAGTDVFLSAIIPWNYSSKFLKENWELIKLQYKFIDKIPENYFANYIRLCNAAKKSNVTPYLEKIKCPSLILSGEKDLVCQPAYGKLISNKIPNSEFLVFKDTGHAVIFEKHDTVNEKLFEFLQKHK